MAGIFSAKNKLSRVGIDFMPTGVAVVVIKVKEKNHALVQLCDFLPAVGGVEQTKVLHQWVEKNNLQKAPCNCLIAQHDVQLFQLEKPAVADDELLQAVSWKINDLINYDVESAVVDVYELPLSPKSPLNYINAVVANENVVAGYVDSIKQSELTLSAIDIHDLVTKNYCKFCDNEGQTIAVLQLSETEGLVTIYHDQDLYVARDFKIGLLEIQTDTDEAEAVYDSLLLELQRSLDYFESTYGLAMVQKMLIFPQTAETSRMANYIQNYVPYELEFVQVNRMVNGQLEQIDRHCFAAYCAALRGVKA